METLEKFSKNGIINIEGETMGVDVQIDDFTPCLVERQTGNIVDTTYSLSSVADRKGLKKEGWLFNWNHESLRDSQIYKLTVKDDPQIQGLVAIEEQPKNYAVHLSLAESAPHNRGENKIYNGVGGHLFAIAVQKSYQAGYGGFIYFEAKNMELVQHYSEKFGAKLIGRPHQYSMIIDEENAKTLLEAYTLEE
ncbi:hypothetical protein [uncultured Neglectibacter sp.]|uniref:hypothetical protein n=1 Tax=uncultured Neglectibacter sp. TaxID=1924108 RepID=UPI0034DEE354